MWANIFSCVRLVLFMCKLHFNRHTEGWDVVLELRVAYHTSDSFSGIVATVPEAHGHSKPLLRTLPPVS